MTTSEMVETIRILVQQRLDEFKKTDQEVDIAASCFWHGVIGMKFLKDRVKDGTLPAGTRVLVQAGSMSWPIMDLQKDDGVSPTHFSYVYKPDCPGNTINIMFFGALPEMHVWNVLLMPKQPPVLVDLCTRYHKIQMQKMIGQKWTAIDPPDYLWHTEDKIPKGVFFEPHMKAIATVLEFAARSKLLTRSEVQSYIRGG